MGLVMFRLPSITPPRNIRTYLFFAFSAVLLGLFIFTNILIGRLATQAERTSQVFATFCATASFPAAQDTIYASFVAEVIESINFPIVLTDIEGLPRAWKGVGVDPLSVPNTSLDSLAAGVPPSAIIGERIEKVRRAALRLDESREPIPLLEPTESREIGLVHWGEPKVLSLLRYVPYVSVGVIIILLWLTFWGARGIRLAEARFIWVGLTKETAHQLGTPLSSLMGWVELLRDRVSNTPGDRPVELEQSFLNQTVSEMENDIERLNRVAARFSHIGSAPALELQDLQSVVKESIAYVKKRVPHIGRAVRIEEEYQETPQVRTNPVLLQWVLENLLVNAVNALEGYEGKILVRLCHDQERGTVNLEVSDSGRGMSPEVQRRAFETGFTTRKRGWGLGLSLAKRIVEEYHGGKIYIRETSPGQGTTFVLTFPV
jgi:signal transduction histidine kinase